MLIANLPIDCACYSAWNAIFKSATKHKIKFNLRTNTERLLIHFYLVFFLRAHVKVTKIREQCQKQEETIREQEGELDSKRSELQKLKDEEAALEREYSENQRNLEMLTKSLQDTQLQICQVMIADFAWRWLTTSKNTDKFQFFFFFGFHR